MENDAIGTKILQALHPIGKSGNDLVHLFPDVSPADLSETLHKLKEEDSIRFEDGVWKLTLRSIRLHVRA